MTREKVDTKALLATVDCCDLVADDLGQPVKRSGKWVFWCCPFHEGDRDPSLAVTVDGFRCFGCGEYGDAIAWLTKYRKLTFMDAVRALGGDPAGNSGESRQKSTLQHATANPTAKKALPDDLQVAWREVIDVCQRQLWSDAGTKARAYLHGRGLKDKTLQSPAWRVGFSTGQTIAGIWIDRGIVLPCFTLTADSQIDYIAYIKVRRPDDHPKYKKLPGHGADLVGLYGADAVQGADQVFVTEGEFDAMLLNQEAGDMVGVCTLGGAGDRFNWARWGKYLSFAENFYICYDSDQAGDKGADAWLSMSGRSQRVSVPQGKDVTDYWKTGADLSSWVLEVLKGCDE